MPPVDEKERLAKQLILAAGSKNEAHRLIDACRTEGKSTRTRGPTYKWAKEDLSELAAILQEVWRDRYRRRLLKREAVDRLRWLVAGNSRPKNSILLTSLLNYSKKRADLDAMARAFAAIDQLLDDRGRPPPRKLLPADAEKVPPT